MIRERQVVAVLGVGIVLAFCAIVQTDAREWVSAGGNFKIDAEFVKLEGGKVYLRKPSGETIPVELSKLSEADRKYVEEKEGKGSGSPGSSPSPSTTTASSTKPKASIALKGVDPDDPSHLVRCFFEFCSYDSDMDFSPDSRFLVSGDKNDGIVVADVVEGKRVSSYSKQVPLGSISCVRFAPNGKRVLVGGDQGRVFVFSIGDDGAIEEVGQISGPTGKKVLAMAVSPDNVTAMISYDDSPLNLCNLETYKTTAQLTRSEKYSFYDIEAVAFGPTGKVGWAMSRETFYTIDPIARTSKQRQIANRLSSDGKPSFSPDGSQLLVATYDGAVLVDGSTGQAIRSFGGRHARAAAFVSGGSKIVVLADGSLQLFKVTGKMLADLGPTESTSLVSRIAVSGDGSLFAIASSHGPARVYKVPDIE